MVSRADVSQLGEVQKDLVERAQRDLVEFFGLLDLSRPGMVRDALMDVVPMLVNEYGEIAATAAAEWYERIHPGTFLAQTSGTFPEDAAVKSVRYHAAALFTDEPGNTVAGLSGAMQRFIYYSGRQTVARNVSLDPERPRFARVTSGAKTCAWCTIMASRGFVYFSEASAGMDDDWHDDCDCLVVPEWDKNPAHITGYDPDSMYEKYLAAREESGGTTDKEIASAMRSMFPDEFTDSHVPLPI